MANESAKPTAFVIMPFRPEFADLYNDFIRPALTDAGYSVSRADDIQHAQNIMRDIILRLKASDLLVADLSESNPNVYYELGLAHALSKPVILLAQNVSEIPFDLRAYRVIPYTPRFSDVLRAKEELTEIARAATSHDVDFGSPISDFLPGTDPELDASTSRPSPPERGILDYLIDVEDGTTEMARCLSDISTQTQTLNHEMNSTMARLAKVADLRTSRTNHQRIEIIRDFARHLDAYGELLERTIREYEPALEKTQRALQEVVVAQSLDTAEDAEEFNVLMGTLDETEHAISDFRTSLGVAEDAVNEMPRVEQSFNEARSRVSTQLRRLITNADRTLAMITRARSIGNARLVRNE